MINDLYYKGKPIKPEVTACLVVVLSLIFLDLELWCATEEEGISYIMLSNNSSINLLDFGINANNAAGSEGHLITDLYSSINYMILSKFK